MSLICPNGHVNDEGNRFCDQCGAQLTSAPTPVASEPPVTAAASSSGSITCPTCGQENLPGTAFCENCGAQLPPPTPVAESEPAAPSVEAASTATSGEGRCPNCGHQNEPGNKYCEQCGAEIVSAGTAASASSADEAGTSEPVAATPEPPVLEAEPVAEPEDQPQPVITEPSVDVQPSVDVPAAEATPVDVASPPIEAAPAVPSLPAAEATVDQPSAASVPSSTPEAPVIESVQPVQPAPTEEKCSNCGAALPPNAKFCMECGAKVEPKPEPQLVRPTHCQGCGAELPPNAKFCLECGTKVELVPATGASVKPVEATYQEQGATAAPSQAEAPVLTSPEPDKAAVGDVDTAIAGTEAAIQPAVAPAAQVAPEALSTAAPSASRVYDAGSEAAPSAPTSVPSASVPDAASVAPVITPPPVVQQPVQASGPRLEGAGATIALPSRSELTVGREDPISGIHPDIDLTTHGGEAGGVSRRHALLRNTNGQWSVVDLDSTNYTRVDGNRVAPNSDVPLHDGARLQFGRVEFVFYAH